MSALSPEERVLIVAPLGQDAPVMAGLLVREGFLPEICRDLSECALKITEGAGVVLLTEEGLDAEGASRLTATLEAQPPWSQLPLIVLTSGGEHRKEALRRLTAALPGDVTILERPMRKATLVSSLEVALRSRRRQYQVRDLIEEQKENHNRLRKHAHQQEQLYDFVAQLNRAQSLAEVFDAVLNNIIAALKADRAAILLCDHEGVMRFAAWRGLSEAYRKSVEGHSPWRADEGNFTAIMFADVASAPLDESLRQVVQKEGIAALAFVPLVYQDKLLGKFMVYYDRPQRFSPAELQLAQTIAHQLAFGIERKRAEQQLRESEERVREQFVELDAIYRTAPLGLAVLDRDLRFRRVNDRLAELNGMPAQEHIGRSVGEIVPALEEQSRRVLEQVLETGAPVRFEFSGQTPAQPGVQRFWDETWYPLRDAAGRIVAVGVVAEEITDRKRTEEALRRAQAELQQHAAQLEFTVAERTARLREMVAELEAFSYSIAHDMRAPLRAMNGFAQMLEEELFAEASPRARDFLRRIAASAQRMDRLIQDVLSYSKIVRSELPLEPVDLDKLTREIIESYPAFQLPHAEITIEGRLPVVQGNVAALTQCISNLVGNGVKFVAPGVFARVKIWAEQSGDYVRVYFHDNGIGIPRDAQSRMFRMFERLHRPQEYEGTGIGLAIVRKAVERMGGQVGVESEAGQGSTFWLQLEPAQP